MGRLAEKVTMGGLAGKVTMGGLAAGQPPMESEISLITYWESNHWSDAATLANT